MAVLLPMKVADIFSPQGGNVARGHLHAVGDPLHEVAAVLVLHVEHLLVYLIHRHVTPEDSSHRQVVAMAGVTGSHHVLGVEYLLGLVMLAVPAGHGSKVGHEEVQGWEGHRVHHQLVQVCVQLAWEVQAGGDPAHGGQHQVAEVSVCGVGQFQGVKANVVQGLIVNGVGFTRVFQQLVDGEGGVLGLHHHVGHLRQGHHLRLKVFMMRSGYSCRILLISSMPIPDPVPPPHRVGQLEALHTVTAL